VKKARGGGKSKFDTINCRERGQGSRDIGARKSVREIVSLYQGKRSEPLKTIGEGGRKEEEKNFSAWAGGDSLNTVFRERENE